MPSIFDIAPPEVVKETMTFERPGHDSVALDLYPLSMTYMTRLIKRFPILGKQMRGESLTDEEMVEEGIKIMPPVIAAGLGHAEDEGVEAAVLTHLTETEQRAAFATVMRLTGGPGGVGVPVPFVNGADQTPASTGSAPSGAASDLSTPRPSTS